MSTITITDIFRTGERNAPTVAAGTGYAFQQEQQHHRNDHFLITITITTTITITSIITITTITIISIITNTTIIIANITNTTTQIDGECKLCVTNVQKYMPLEWYAILLFTVLFDSNDGCDNGDDGDGNSG
jgi:hypothetical protein